MYEITCSTVITHRNFGYPAVLHIADSYIVSTVLWAIAIFVLINKQAKIILTFTSYRFFLKNMFFWPNYLK